MAMRREPNEPKIERHGRKFRVTVTWNNVRYRPSFETEEEALVYKTEQMARMAKGLNIEPPKGMQSQNADGLPVTLQQLFEHTKKRRWLKRGPQGGPIKSWKHYEVAARQVVEVLGPNTKVSSLDSFMIDEALYKFQEKRGNSVATTNRRKAALSVMLKEAFKLNVISKVPLIEKDPETYSRSFRILPSLEDAVLTWAIAHAELDFYDFIVLALYLGQRENEILRLRFSETAAYPSDGYLDEDFAVFPEQSSRNKSTVTRAIPLRPIVMDVITRRQVNAASPSARILEGLTKRKLDYLWRKMRAELIKCEQADLLAQKREGLPVGTDFCIHILRHEFCSRLGDDGFDIPEIMRYSGHTTPAMCRRYVKPHKVARRRLLARVPGALEPGLSGGLVPPYAPAQPAESTSTGFRVSHDRAKFASIDAKHGDSSMSQRLKFKASKISLCDTPADPKA
jgi:integrase